MGDHKYTVLWIDDKHEQLQGFKMQASLSNIELVAFKSRTAGLAELKDNYSDYDAILLDAIFVENEKDVTGSEHLSNLNITKEKILQLPKKFDVFVFTGQKKLFEDETFNSFFPKYYKKGDPSDVQRLFLDIKEAADKQPDTQIRDKYDDVFNTCTEKYIGKKAKNSLLYLLKTVESDFDRTNTEEKLNSIRKIITQLFTALKRIGVLPNEVLKGDGGITNSSKFLSGNHPSYILKEEILPPAIIKECP